MYNTCMRVNTPKRERFFLYINVQGFFIQKMVQISFTTLTTSVARRIDGKIDE
jgi:hypothetical protein